MTPRAKPRLRAPVGRVHVPAEDPNVPGCCITCHRPLDATTDRHVAAADLPTPDPETRALTARITGDRDRED
jgi:hypothetical protein